MGTRLNWLKPFLSGRPGPKRKAVYQNLRRDPIGGS